MAGGLICRDALIRGNHVLLSGFSFYSDVFPCYSLQLKSIDEIQTLYSSTITKLSIPTIRLNFSIHQYFRRNYFLNFHQHTLNLKVPTRKRTCQSPGLSRKTLPPYSAATSLSFSLYLSYRPSPSESRKVNFDIKQTLLFPGLGPSVHSFAAKER